MAETFEQIQTALLHRSYERLGELIEEGFGAFIADEVALLTRRVAAIYGPRVYERIGGYVIETERMRNGFCVACKGSPRRVDAPHDVCAECLAELTTAASDEVTR